MYLLNRFETNCWKSMIPFHAIWGVLCYTIIFLMDWLLKKKTHTQTQFHTLRKLGEKITRALCGWPNSSLMGRHKHTRMVRPWTYLRIQPIGESTPLGLIRHVIGMGAWSQNGKPNHLLQKTLNFSLLYLKDMDFKASCFSKMTPWVFFSKAFPKLCNSGNYVQHWGRLNLCQGPSLVHPVRSNCNWNTNHSTASPHCWHVVSRYKSLCLQHRSDEKNRSDVKAFAAFARVSHWSVWNWNDLWIYWNWSVCRYNFLEDPPTLTTDSSDWTLYAELWETSTARFFSNLTCPDYDRNHTVILKKNADYLYMNYIS